MKQPLTKKQLFEKLKPLEKKFDKFADNQTGSLNSEEVELMKDVYADVRVFAAGAMGQTLNASCATCVKEAFHVFTSLYNRLKKDPTVNEEAEAEPIVYQSPVVADETDYSDQLKATTEQPIAIEPLDFPKTEPKAEPVQVKELEPKDGATLNTKASQTEAQKQAETVHRNKVAKPKK